ncbi:cation-translocating P-type ATPase [Rheinheimera baltica]|uniref:cation transporting ATPase C-terminal domain-containing protein n=1 Tax=Rheinheimera baltica TaxID=67576 RepID=UPI00273D077A|nr:cation-translocating P-type ATPase [Rheinheimera baltica]MDP5142109.1 cation-translocating P-type ATPase [Rheinheimera baltica]
MSAPETAITDNLTGLCSSEAQQRLKTVGANTLPSAKPRSIFAIAWSIVREPMFILLISCGSIYLLLGSKTDAYILLGSVLIIMAMSFAQERKSERALEALRDLSSPRALVLRDSKPQRIAGREVVPGDIIFLVQGDRVPADAVLLLLLLGVYLAAIWAGLAEQQARALTFSAMIIGDIWLIFINRSWSLPLVKSIKLPNPALWWVVASGLMMLTLALFLPVMNTLFHFERPPPGYLALTIVAVSISLLLIATFTRGQKQSKKH